MVVRCNGRLRLKRLRRAAHGRGAPLAGAAVPRQYLWLALRA